MSKLKLVPFFLILILLLITLCVFPQVQTVTPPQNTEQNENEGANENEGPEDVEESEEEIVNVNNNSFYNNVSLSSAFNLHDTTLLFIHSDTLFRFGWCNDTIHVRRYDLTKMNDTVPIILQDCEGTFCYNHPYFGHVTSDFGIRRGRYHYGTDVKLYTGDSVYNAFDGIVRVSKYSKSYGNVVVVRHFNGLETLYSHLSKRLVEPNQPVKAGQILGLGGNTGRSRGSHLHFEVRYFGEPINPNDIIDFNSFCLKSDTLLLTQKNFQYLVEARKAQYYTIRNGDTLSKIARKHRTTIKALCRLNNMKQTAILRVGRRIRVA